MEFQPTLLFQKETLKNHHLSQKEGSEIQEDHHLESRISHQEIQRPSSVGRVMAEVPGSWRPSDSTINKANIVIEATAASGKLYRDGLGMIASENIISPMVQKIVASDLHGRYAEGLPGKRYYRGCDDFDTIESLGIKLAKEVFGANFANIQSTSGTVSNIAALKGTS